VAPGATVRVAGLLAILDCVTPSDQVTVHGPIPVNAAEMLKLLPTQFVALPETAAAGLAVTATIWLHVLVQPFALVIVKVTVNEPALDAVIDTFCELVLPTMLALVPTDHR
jgi:hypothetical protein